MARLEDGDESRNGDVVAEDQVVGASLYLEGLSSKGEFGQGSGIVTVVGIEEDVVPGDLVTTVGLETVDVGIRVLGYSVVDVVDVVATNSVT